MKKIVVGLALIVGLAFGALAAPLQGVMANPTTKHISAPLNFWQNQTNDTAFMLSLSNMMVMYGLGGGGGVPFTGSTTNLTNYGALYLPAWNTSTNACYMVGRTPGTGKVVDVLGVQYNQSYGLFSSYGFYGDGSRLYNIPSSALADRALSAVKWTSEDPYTVFANATAGTAIPMFSKINYQMFDAETLSLLATNSGTTNIFTPNYTNAALVTATNRGAFTLVSMDGAASATLEVTTNGVEATNLVFLVAGLDLAPQVSTTTNPLAVRIWNSNNAAIYARWTNGTDTLITSP